MTGHWKFAQNIFFYKKKEEIRLSLPQSRNFWGRGTVGLNKKCACKNAESIAHATDCTVN